MPALGNSICKYMYLHVCGCPGMNLGMWIFVNVKIISEIISEIMFIVTIPFM